MGFFFISLIDFYKFACKQGTLKDLFNVDSSEAADSRLGIENTPPFEEVQSEVPQHQEPHSLGEPATAEVSAEAGSGKISQSLLEQVKAIHSC